MTAKRVTLSALAGTLLLVLAFTYGHVQAEASAQTAMKDSSKAHTTKNAHPNSGIQGSTKLCSAIGPPSFRDTIDAPDSWDAAMCQSFSFSIGPPHYQLGCANPDNTSWGGWDGATPPDNRCNWK